MDNDENDYNRISEVVNKASKIMREGSHSTDEDKDSDSLTITKNAWIDTQIELERLSKWCKGLAESHRLYSKEEDVNFDV